MSVEDDVLADITPSPDEAASLADTVAALVAACNAALAPHGGEASVQGSVAKGTWLAGNTDIDCFLLMDPGMDEAALKQVALHVGPQVLSDCRTKYAQHPYLIGSFRDYDVDLVPAYHIRDAGARMSAVDRTPFHTAWVKDNLDGKQIDHVRLLKRWCKGVGVYGAETAIGGFSGYLLEVLIGRHGDLHGVLEWLADRRRADDRTGPVDAPLFIQDPVDATRNVAAAVQTDTLQQAAHAARAYLAAPSRSFFFPAPPRVESPDSLHQALRARQQVWVGLRVRPQTDRLDIVFPQFQRTGRSIREAWERAGFPVHAAQVAEVGDAVVFQWLVDDAELPASRRHRGPAADARPNGDRFRKKWNDHPDAMGPVQEVDGHLEVELCIRHRTPGAYLRGNLQDLATAKHARAAVAAGAVILEDPARVDDDWAPAVADFVLQRPPWER